MQTVYDNYFFDKNGSKSLNCNSYSLQNQGNTIVKVNETILYPLQSANIEPPVLLKIKWALKVEFLSQPSVSNTPDRNKLLLTQYIYDKCEM